MLTVIVRSKRDADALRNMIKNYRSDWGIEVETLKGKRGTDVIDAVKELVSDNKFYLVLLGREEADVIKELSDSTPPNVIVHGIRKKRIRNTRLSELNWELEVAKSQPRLWIEWSGDTPFIAKKYVRGEPGTDVFLGWGLWWKTLGLGEPSHKGFLVKKSADGVHTVIAGGRAVALTEITDNRIPQTVLLGEVRGFELKEFANLSRNVIRSFVRGTAKLFEGCEKAIVPWSGGKDSTAALLIAKEYCDEVEAIYVDTGVDMGLNKYYIEKIANEMNVNYEVVRAPVKENIMELGFPSRDNRWCTGLKIKALEDAIKRRGKVKVVVGDRDAESISRSRRWFEREWEGVAEVLAPLKLWSGAMVLAYLLSENVLPNPLYALGFYRLGCYVCPFLRAYERKLLREVRAAKIGADEDLLNQFLGRHEGYDLGM
ncbi:hypothetical protein EYM_06810 [Ignicoccus islandicus DSM 13165]|uniref:Phosphoadenosine phosphosulphate reductase domain-containing protein n=1 Tax=Ignicoccus islandicus DSM 13165 TaxID=940295 RepID=A0A0U3F7F5_9CREN|nr:phosphoadenosine phosphosulfate reductase family protein [Ignicoccus islandicus]ALU11976.1 hypothetical protein EYM_06810 [Ignicoccus islandicus DSM 13165]